MSIQEGTYKVNFSTGLGAVAGIVVLRNGTVRGGDSGMLYVGTYSENGDDFTASVVASRHTANAPMSVFGVDKATITLTGKSDATSAVTTGRATEASGVQFQARLSRVAD